MRRLTFSIIGVIAAAVLVIGINMFADLRLAAVRIDMTQGKIYTLSPGTRQILDGLKEPVTLRFFYSRRLGATIPVYGTYADHVTEMLQEYATASHGKVKVELYDPEPFSDTEDRAVAYGLQGVPVDNAGNQVYFGLAGSNLEDDERTIPFFQAERERFLEFDLTKLVYELSNPKRNTVGLMSSLPIDGDPRAMMMNGGRGPGGQPYASSVLLRETNTVKTVPLDAQVIDPDIQVLLVAEARDLPDATLYAIDQFVMRGGKLMVMVDPWSEALAAVPSPTGMPPTDTSSDLKKLFDAWGIVYDRTKVIGDLTGAWRVRSSDDDRMQAVNYVAWFNIRDGINHDDPASADLTQITVASAGFISKAANAPIEFTPLLSSSDRSGLIPRDQLAMPDPAKLLAGFKPEGGPRVIAARVHGVLKSAFTGPPDLPAGQKRPDNFPAFKGQTEGPANMVVVADFGHSGRPVLGAHLRLFRSIDRNSVLRQRTLRRQSDRHAGRRRRVDRPARARRHQPPLHTRRGDPERGRSAIPADRARPARASGRCRETTARAAHRRRRIRRPRDRGRHHAGATSRHRCRAQGHRRYPQEAARCATGTEPGDFVAANLADGGQHRPGAYSAGDPGDRSGAVPTSPTRPRAVRGLSGSARCLKPD